MHIFESTVDGIVLLALQGSLLGDKDATTLQMKVKGHLEEGNKLIILDLATLEFVNSMGLGSFLAVRTSIARAGGKLILANVGGKVMEILRLTQADRIFTMCGSVEEGMREITK